MVEIRVVSSELWLSEELGFWGKIIVVRRGYRGKGVMRGVPGRNVSHKCEVGLGVQRHTLDVQGRKP